MSDPYYTDDAVTLWHGDCLDVLTCTVHGNTIDPARARALGQHLIAWADRKEGHHA